MDLFSGNYIKMFPLFWIFVQDFIEYWEISPIEICDPHFCVETFREHFFIVEKMGKSCFCDTINTSYTPRAGLIGQAGRGKSSLRPAASKYFVEISCEVRVISSRTNR